MKKLFPLFFVFSALFLGCDGNDPDFLNESMTVYSNDGTTALSNFSLKNFDWVAKLKDGSLVMKRFDGNQNHFTTDANGQLSFTTADMKLQSEVPHYSCYDVCVQESPYTVRECIDWEYDENGYEYCAYYDYVTYYECVAYAQHCDTYYPFADLDEVLYAWGEIGYSIGNSTVQTQSNKVTYASSGYSDSNESLWTQSEEFVTILDPAQNSSQEPTRVGRTRPAPEIFKGDALKNMTAAQKAKLDKFLNNYGTRK